MAGFFGKDKDVEKDSLLYKKQTNEYNKPREFRKEGKMNNNVTILTPDVEIKGTIKFSNVLQVDGKFEGDLITNDGNVTVGNTGSLKANLKVKNATIEGRVDGNIIASEKVELKSKAQLIGDLKAKSLSIEEGVVFIGKCTVNPEGIEINKALKENRKDESENQESLIK